MDIFKIYLDFLENDRNKILRIIDITIGVITLIPISTPENFTEEKIICLVIIFIYIALLLIIIFCFILRPLLIVVYFEIIILEVVYFGM